MWQIFYKSNYFYRRWIITGFQVYLRFSSISRFSAECDRLVPPVPKTRLTFVRTRSRAVSVNLFFIHSTTFEERFLFGTEKETNEWSNNQHNKQELFICLFVSGGKILDTRDKTSSHDKICNSSSLKRSKTVITLPTIREVSNLTINHKYIFQSLFSDKFVTFSW